MLTFSVFFMTEWDMLLIIISYDQSIFKSVPDKSVASISMIRIETREMVKMDTRF